MTRQRYFLLLVALLLIVLSWWGIAAARTGLIVKSLNRDGVPLLYVAPQTTEKIPGVLVAHGFAGSKQLMLGYAQVLAHSGYAVMLWDFSGHAANAHHWGVFHSSKTLMWRMPPSSSNRKLSQLVWRC
jgi:predicted alpha/beta-fold hydrolase